MGLILPVGVLSISFSESSLNFSLQALDSAVGLNFSVSSTAGLVVLDLYSILNASVSMSKFFVSYNFVNVDAVK